MARQDDGKGLLTSWQEAVGEGTDPLRGLMEHMLQQLLKEVNTDAPSLEEAREALREAVQKLSDRYPEVARMLDEEGEQMPGVYALPAEHRKRMRSTNMLERWFEDVRRRTRVVRIFSEPGLVPAADRGALRGGQRRVAGAAVLADETGADRGGSGRLAGAGSG